MPYSPGACPGLDVLLAELSTSSVEAGRTVTVGASGFDPQEQVEVWLFSEPQRLSTVTSTDDGTVEATVTVPAGTTLGAHTLVLVGESDVRAEGDLTVVAATGDGGGTGTDDGDGDGDAGGSTGGTGTTGSTAGSDRLARTGVGILLPLLLGLGLLGLGGATVRASGAGLGRGAAGAGTVEDEASFLGPDAVADVVRHMSEDHAADTLTIVHGCGGVRSATQAWMTHLDVEAGTYVAVVDGEERLVRIPWHDPLTSRQQVRVEVVRLHEEAVRRLGTA